MIYFKASQPVPGKGDAWTYYECDDDETVLRQLTHIPLSSETTRVPDPIMKRLYRKDLLMPATAEEFAELWG